MTRSADEAGAVSPLWWWPRAAPWLLLATVCVVYFPSLHGGFLNWDDPWLYQQNSVLMNASPHALVGIWTDLSRATRAVLGAEYLPIRDTELWLEFRLFGLSPHALRVTSLAIYLAAIWLVRVALRNTLKNDKAAEIAAWVFALHPIHVESVAWLAGRKDVLALLFVAAALAMYSTSSRHRVWSVPLLLLAAHLSKSMTVSAGGLLVAQSLLARRELEPKILVPAFVVAVLAFALHLHVGGVVGIVQEPLGGSRLTQLLTMGPVWLGYLVLLLYPPGESLVHDVRLHTHPSLAAISGYALLAIWGVAAIVLWRKRDERVGLASFIWFLVPLLPVSQVLYPLQSQMADRYLFLSVMALALPAGVLLARWARAGTAASIALIVLFSGFTAARSSLFAESELVFRDATSKTVLSPVAPYQLGLALEEHDDLEGAEQAYRTAMERASGRDEVGRRATANLARILGVQGKLKEAERVLAAGHERWPDDRAMRDNLEKIVEVQKKRGDAARE